MKTAKECVPNLMLIFFTFEKYMLLYPPGIVYYHILFNGTATKCSIIAL